MKPVAKSDAYEVEVKSKLKAPEPEAGVSIFFVSPENNLVRQDPRQITMELREIGPAAAHKGVA